MKTPVSLKPGRDPFAGGPQDTLLRDAILQAASNDGLHHLKSAGPATRRFSPFNRLSVAPRGLRDATRQVLSVSFSRLIPPCLDPQCHRRKPGFSPELQLPVDDDGRPASVTGDIHHVADGVRISSTGGEPGAQIAKCRRLNARINVEAEARPASLIQIVAPTHVIWHIALAH